jgi:pimeloyl-ACP methyl ester carboxylesterase
LGDAYHAGCAPPQINTDSKEWLMDARSEIASSVVAGGIKTNYHDQGSGEPVLLIHGSGPGVSAWANWRAVLPVLAKRFRVIAPDVVGFGYTERPDGAVYTMQAWIDHLSYFVDALALRSFSIVGNSFGGAIAMKLTTSYPDRVDRLVLMGSVGVDFPITEGLDAVWGYDPSASNMRELLELFAYRRELASDELAHLRFEASTRPGVHEAYSAMFPAPRQNGVKALTLPDADIRSIRHETMIIHGREDRIIPLQNSIRLHQMIESSQLHVFGRCGHWVQMEQTTRFIQLVGNFLAESAG